VFTTVEQLSPAWLTDCLRSSGTLPYGRVLTIDGQTDATIRSRVGSLRLRYSADAPLSAPLRLFLKNGAGSDASNDDWQGEVQFYQTLAPALVSQTVRCHAAAYAPEPARFHLLLDDLSDTHTRPTWPLPPTSQQLEQAIDCLASIHAHWWNHPSLGREVLPRFTETSLAAWLSVWEQQLTPYLVFLGDRLSPRRRAIYESALPQVLALLLQRRGGGRHYTIAHQDAHIYNFLFPGDPATDTTRLVDWATWDVELGARDLAYLLALHLFPEQRALVEKPLLRRYHAQLIRLGVDDYGWDDLWADYRLFVIWNLFVPVEQLAWHVPARIWWWHVERSFLAFDDLDCVDLLH